MNTYDKLWNDILEELEQIYTEEVYNEIFAPITSTHKYQNGLIFVIVPSLFIKNRISRIYATKINELAEKIYGQPIRFKFVVADELIDDAPQERSLNLNTYRPGNLNNAYSFDNFVVGKSNTFAFRMAMKVADQPGVVANPFYIFGDVGLGKTHLMQAIGNYILDNNVSQRVLYVKADGFIEDYTTLLRKEKMDDFNTKYRDIDVLLVDDIQIMAKANQTQMEFFKLFDYLYLNNKQIIITSDKPASELKDIMTRLTTRFEAGLTVDIQVPDLDHRITILKRKLSSFDPNNDVSDEVLEFIASSFVTNIREMEGALIRLLSYASACNLDIDLDVTYEALEPLLKTKKRSNSLNENNYDKIQSVVSDFYNISLQDLIGKKRHSKYTLPRHIAMFVIKNKYNIPYKTIGTLFSDRDHSTVLAACEKIENELKQDQNLRVAVDTILKKIET